MTKPRIAAVKNAVRKTGECAVTLAGERLADLVAPATPGAPGAEPPASAEPTKPVDPLPPKPDQAGPQRLAATGAVSDMSALAADRSSRLRAVADKQMTWLAPRRSGELMLHVPCVCPTPGDGEKLINPRPRRPGESPPENPSGLMWPLLVGAGRR